MKDAYDDTHRGNKNFLPIRSKYLVMKDQFLDDDFVVCPLMEKLNETKFLQRYEYVRRTLIETGKNLEFLINPKIASCL